MHYKIYVFDAYGTLFDVHAAVRRHADALGPDGQALSEIWRAKQLEYSWTRTLMGAYADFGQLTEQALDFALAKMPSVDRTCRDRLIEAYRSLDCYADVPPVLRALKADGARIAILSNGSPDMLDAAVRSAGLEAVVDDVFSVDAVKRFKTDPAAYAMVSTALQVDPGAVSFQSSNRWDVAGAVRFGFRSVWVNRSGQPDEYPDLAPSITIGSLEDLIAAS